MQFCLLLSRPDGHLLSISLQFIAPTFRWQCEDEVVRVPNASIMEETTPKVTRYAQENSAASNSEDLIQALTSATSKEKKKKKQSRIFRNCRRDRKSRSSRRCKSYKMLSKPKKSRKPKKRKAKRERERSKKKSKYTRLSNKKKKKYKKMKKTKRDRKKKSNSKSNKSSRGRKSRPSRDRGHSRTAASPRRRFRTDRHKKVYRRPRRRQRFRTAGKNRRGQVKPEVSRGVNTFDMMEELDERSDWDFEHKTGRFSDAASNETLTEQTLRKHPHLLEKKDFYDYT